MARFSIRPMQEADRERVIDLLWLLNRFEHAIAADRATDRETAILCLSDDIHKVQALGGVHLVAETGSGIAGYCCCAITMGGPYIRDELRKFGYVTSLVVAPEARKTGIGEALMRAAEDFTRRSGLRSFAVGHLCHNEAAARLYARLGLQSHAIERVKWLSE